MAFLTNKSDKMNRSRKKQILALIILFFFFGSSTFAIISFSPITSTNNAAVPAGVGAVGSTHIHSDFKVYMDGQAINFLQKKYDDISPYIHLHVSVGERGGEGSGNLIHIEATNPPIGFFFETLGMKFNSTCFNLDTGEQYCNQEDKTLKFYVNGLVNNQFEKYIPKDLDKILISYGNETDEQIQTQIDSVTDESYFVSGSGRGILG